MDLEDRLWRLPGRREKTGAAHAVPLSSGAVELLRQVQAHRPESRWVFPSDHSEGPITTAQKALERIRALSGTKDWTLHDVRRTVRSGLGALGVPPHVAERVLGHSLQGIVAVYDRHDYMPEMSTALERWAAHLASVVAQPDGRTEVAPVPAPRSTEVRETVS